MATPQASTLADTTPITGLAALGVPVLVCDAERRVVLVGETVKAWLGRPWIDPGTLLGVCCPSKASRQRFEAELDAASPGRPRKYLGLFRAARGCVLVNVRISRLDHGGSLLAFVACTPEDVVAFASASASAELVACRVDGCGCRLLEAIACLTERQRAVLRALARGVSIDALVEGLGLSRHTVKNHVRAVYARLSVRSRDELYSRLARVADAGSPR